jgi:hypothetical protein
LGEEESMAKNRPNMRNPVTRADIIIFVRSPSSYFFSASKGPDVAGRESDSLLSGFFPIPALRGWDGVGRASYPIERQNRFG